MLEKQWITLDLKNQFSVLLISKLIRIDHTSLFMKIIIIQVKLKIDMKS